LKNTKRLSVLKGANRNFEKFTKNKKKVAEILEKIAQIALKFHQSQEYS